jgi:hypothetical protein
MQQMMHPEGSTRAERDCGLLCSITIAIYLKKCWHLKRRRTLDRNSGTARQATDLENGQVSKALLYFRNIFAADNIMLKSCLRLLAIVAALLAVLLLRTRQPRTGIYSLNDITIFFVLNALSH